MTDVAPATDAKVPPPANSEDEKLAQFGYTQKLDRSVGRLASFAIGFATISATTAVQTRGWNTSVSHPSAVIRVPNVIARNDEILRVSVFTATVSVITIKGSAIRMSSVLAFGSM